MDFFKLRSTSADEISYFVSSGGPLNLLGPNGEPSNTQVGIVSWGVVGCYHQAFPSVFTRVSEVADWVKETVCARKGELCKGGSKAA
jgi:secreted trypsin-like serine protease